jgi:hypothetical protein
MSAGTAAGRPGAGRGPEADREGGLLGRLTRGTSISTGPASVTSVLGRIPFREFPPFRPAGSCLP